MNYIKSTYKKVEKSPSRTCGLALIVLRERTHVKIPSENRHFVIAQPGQSCRMLDLRWSELIGHLKGCFKCQPPVRSGLVSLPLRLEMQCMHQSDTIENVYKYPIYPHQANLSGKVTILKRLKIVLITYKYIKVSFNDLKCVFFI